MNLNALTLTTHGGQTGTYSLPSSAVSIVTLGRQPPPENNLFVDSQNHYVMWGAGGDWGTAGNKISVAQLTNPLTGSGVGLVSGAAVFATMPAYSASNTTWDGFGYPHGSAMYVDSSGNSVALWMNQAGTYLAEVTVNQVLASPNQISSYVRYIGVL